MFTLVNKSKFFTHLNTVIFRIAFLSVLHYLLSNIFSYTLIKANNGSQTILFRQPNNVFDNQNVDFGVCDCVFFMLSDIPLARIQRCKFSFNKKGFNFLQLLLVCFTKKSGKLS
uniref:(northern house mosquito) hypothetical protein n=1 Tax=Culex pipiens TaxID=7175 RepID=A0A8D8KIY4_CULPI